MFFNVTLILLSIAFVGMTALMLFAIWKMILSVNGVTDTVEKVPDAWNHLSQEIEKTTKAIDNLKEIEHHRFQQIKTLNIRLNYLNSRVGELIFLQGGKANQEVLRGGLEEYFSSLHGERKQSQDKDLNHEE